jgi:hypothetical protein
MWYLQVNKGVCTRGPNVNVDFTDQMDFKAICIQQPVI